ncbi:sigma factor [Kribbella sp. WER1]
MPNKPPGRKARRKYRGRGVDEEDLEQIAVEHLIRALHNYHPAPGTGFRSYAVPMIRGGIRHHFRDHAWAIRLPRRLRSIIGHLQVALST